MTVDKDFKIHGNSNINALFNFSSKHQRCIKASSIGRGGDILAI